MKDTPQSHIGIINYLSSKLIKGVGPKIAQKIVATFQENTVQVLNFSPERLVEVPGISTKLCQSLSVQLKEQYVLRETILFLQRYDIPVHYGIRIHDKYKEQSITVIKTDPFILSKEMDGVGFKTADLIATHIGIALDSPIRIKAGIQHILKELQEEGNTCYPENKLCLRVQEILNTEEFTIAVELIHKQLYALHNEKTLHICNLNGEPHVWGYYLFLAEKSIAFHIKRILFSTKRTREIQVSKALEWVENQLSIHLEDKQKDAVAASLSKKIHIITGGPGTGKSTITQAILRIFEKLTSKILLAAPTGKAAKRMSEITKRHAATIHSLLQYDFASGSFKRDPDNPLDCDLVIIDEFSMLDTSLMNHFLRALPDHVILICIGDAHQLPSVGPGNVLKDLITSGKIPVTCLTKIFRQVHDSNIVINAHRVNEGQSPILFPQSGKKDFLFFQKEDPEEAVQHIIHLITEFIPKKFHIYPRDIQVLAPMKKGVLGIQNLNFVLKKALNVQASPQNSLYAFSVGDKVMQIRNNYRKEVFNGDTGYVTSIDRGEKTLLVNIDGKLIPYSIGELKNLVLAYATSIHKYQGSESPCVVIPIHTSHFTMLYRNLLYTAITRGKQLVVLVGTSKAIAIATRNNKIQERSTGLCELFLKQI